MMYETEEQQVEAIKKWWQENGKSVVAGVVLGLGGVLGWQAWNQHTDTVGAQASNLYEQLVASVRQGSDKSAATQKQLLHDEFGGTPYAAFAELQYAKLMLEKDDTAAAESALLQAIAKAPDAAVRSIGVLRLARIRIADKRLDEADALLRQHPAPAAFSAEYAVLRGDLARARGDFSAARAAYQGAIDGNAGNAGLVQLKLENLPPAS